MLPIHSSRPSSGGKPRIFFPPSVSPTSPSPTFSQLFSSLRSRTRLTNLTISLLISALVGSLLLNILAIHPFSSGKLIRRTRIKSEGGWEDAATPLQHDSGIPLSIETTIDRDDRYTLLEHMIMVPGHAIWIGNDRNRIGEDEDWVLQPVQQGGSVRTFVRHVVEGARVLKEDPNSLLVFSGGATRAHPAPPMSEAYSYRSLATILDLLPSDLIPSNPTGSSSPLPLNLRAVTEEYALDSYENLLFSISRFKEITGRYPKKITVVGYGMKRRRFTDLHRAAIGFPLDNWNYIGIDDEGDTTDQYAGELKYGYTPFLSSPSGCHPPLSIKRVNRNPFMRYHPYHTSCPEMAELLEWCPLKRGQVDQAEDMQVFEGYVPWRDEPDKGSGKGWRREKW